MYATGTGRGGRARAALVTTRGEQLYGSRQLRQRMVKEKGQRVAGACSCRSVFVCVWGGSAVKGVMTRPELMRS
jgi:hypothetical protein